MSHSFSSTYCPKPGEADMLNSILEESDAQIKKQVDEYVDQIVAQANAEESGQFQFVVANETMASLVRGFLAERGHGHLSVVTAASLPTTHSPKGDYWTPAMAEAKAAYAAAHDNMGQRVRHHSQFTKSQPAAKARKAARKRAKAGRRASR